MQLSVDMHLGRVVVSRWCEPSEERARPFVAGSVLMYFHRGKCKRIIAIMVFTLLTAHDRCVSLVFSLKALKAVFSGGYVVGLTS